MGLLDDTLKQLSQGGNVPQPLLVVFQELLTGGSQQGGQQAPAPRQQQAEAPPPKAAVAQQGGSGGEELGGLGGLLAQLQQSGLDDAVRWWIGGGENKPVHPDALGTALGKDNIQQMADKAGFNVNDLLAQLSKALPGLIDQLTHDGRIPTQDEIKQRLKGQ